MIEVLSVSACECACTCPSTFTWVSVSTSAVTTISIITHHHLQGLYFRVSESCMLSGAESCNSLAWHRARMYRHVESRRVKLFSCSRQQPHARHPTSRHPQRRSPAWRQAREVGQTRSGNTGRFETAGLLAKHRALNKARCPKNSFLKLS